MILKIKNLIFNKMDSKNIPTDYLSSWVGWLIIIWLIIITALLIAVAVGAWMGKIDVGPTGPSGSPGQLGPTGPTGPPHANQSMVTLPSCTCNSVSALPTNNTIAFCNPCQFYSMNADVSNYQTIPGPTIPTVVRWAFTNPINSTYMSYATNGLITLIPGKYQLSSTIVYPPINKMGNSNVSGTYKYMAYMLTDNTFNNVVSDTFIIDRTQAITNSVNATVLSLSTTFDVTTRQNLSVLTWQDASRDLEIGTMNTLPPINTTFNLIKLN